MVLYYSGIYCETASVIIYLQQNFVGFARCPKITIGTRTDKDKQEQFINNPGTHKLVTKSFSVAHREKYE